MSKFFIENYGCQMNLSEADSLHALLSDNGHEETNIPENAEVVILNTCSVRKTAEERIIGRLGYYRGLRQNKHLKIKVILMGCMAQNEGRDIKKEFSDILSLVWGTYNKDGILHYINSLDRASDFLETSDYHFMDAKPQKKYPFKSFLPISHGCNNFCSYCIVPYVREREIHRNSREIIDNVLRLMDAGVQEVILLGQNVNSYRFENAGFPDLLDQIAKKTKIPRLGFLTSHPKDFSSDLLEVIRENENVMKNIHLPLQSGNDRILKLMNRKYTAAGYLDKIEKARTIPDAVFSTDIIVGFPSETEEEFLDTLNIMEKAGYHEAFMYHYNIRPGTEAAGFPETITADEKMERLSRLIRFQSDISSKLLKKETGKIYNVLFDSVSKKRKNEIAGRTHNGLMVFTEGNPDLIGKIVRVEITGVSGTGLKGKLL